jgi:hypothetical protein
MSFDWNHPNRLPADQMGEPPAMWNIWSTDAMSRARRSVIRGFILIVPFGLRDVILRPIPYCPSAAMSGTIIPHIATSAGQQ